MYETIIKIKKRLKNLDKDKEKDLSGENAQVFLCLATNVLKR